MNQIQIHRRHLSPAASEHEALAFIDELHERGWTEVVYTTEIKPMWRFGNSTDLFAFERDFEALHAKYVQPFTWSIAFDVTDDPLAGIKGEIEEVAHQVPHIEYGEKS